MSNNGKNNNSILGNVLKGVGALIIAAAAGAVGGKTHSNINESKRRSNTDCIEKSFNTKK